MIKGDKSVFQYSGSNGFATAIIVFFVAVLFTTAAKSETMDDYLEKIKAARQEIARIQKEPDRSGYAIHRLKELKNIEVKATEGKLVRIQNSWVDAASRDIEGGTPTDIRKTLAKLDAISMQVRDASQADSQNADIGLPGVKGFDNQIKKPVLPSKNLGVEGQLDKLAKWLRDLKNNKSSEESNLNDTSSGGVGLFSSSTFVLIVLVLIVLIIVYVIYSVLKNRSSSMTGFVVRGKISKRELENALRHTPQEWKTLAREYCEKGDYSQALRALYLNLLVALHRRRIIYYVRHKTNWEYVWDLAGIKGKRKLFSDLTRAFDYKWYGRQECSKDEYISLENLAEAIASSHDTVANAQGNFLQST